MLNQSIPDFEIEASCGTKFRPSQYAGHVLVLYFYPKDSTPGCTLEGQQFRDLHPEFAKTNAFIFGISRDSLKSHQNFKSKQCFPFELLSDPEELACHLFGVIKMKNMYGKQVRGIERSTFVVDAGGVIRCEWRGVKVDGHAQAVLNFIKTL